MCRCSVDQSHTATSREFIRMFDASPDVKVAYYCNSIPEAESVVGHQKANGILYFPEDFERTINRGEQAHVSIYCDMSLMLAYKAIYQTSLYVSLNIGKERQKEMIGTVTVRDEELRTQPLEVVEEPIFNVTGGYGNAVLPGVLILILQQTLLLGIGLAAGTARENNRYQDLVPISKHHNGILKIVLGKSFCYFMIYCVISAYITFSCTIYIQFHDVGGSCRPYSFAFALPFIGDFLWNDVVVPCSPPRKCNATCSVYLCSFPILNRR